MVINNDYNDKINTIDYIITIIIIIIILALNVNYNRKLMINKQTNKQIFTQN